MGPRFRMGRRRGLLVGAAVGASVANSRNRNAASNEAPQQVVAQPSSYQDDQISQIEKLSQLKDQGILTQEEFDAKKKQILGI